MSLDEVRAQLLRYRTDLAWLSTCPVPTIAAINGAALGGGLELALLCDLRVAAPHASFALPETSLGIIPAAGGTQYLPRIVGAAKARELILLGTRLSAAEALRIGLIHRICDAGVGVLEDALGWVAPITRDDRAEILRCHPHGYAPGPPSNRRTARRQSYHEGRRSVRAESHVAPPPAWGRPPQVRWRCRVARPAAMRTRAAHAA